MASRDPNYIRPVKITDAKKGTSYHGKSLDKITTAGSYTQYHLHGLPDSFAVGSLAARFGIPENQTVPRSLLENLLYRTNPWDGTKLPGLILTANTVAFDATTTHPKTYSGIAILDQRLPEISKKTCAKLIKKAEKKAKHRVRKGHRMLKRMGCKKEDLQYQENSGNCLAIIITEYYSRSGDPALHFHVIIPNLTWVESENEFRALYYRELLRELHRLQKWYSDTLRKEVEKLGYKTRSTANGGWEIDCLSDLQIQKLSTRAQDIKRNKTRLVNEFNQLCAIPRENLTKDQLKRLKDLTGGNIRRTEMDPHRLESLAKHMHRPRKRHYSISQIRERMVHAIGFEAVRKLSELAVKNGADPLYAHIRDPRKKCACDEAPKVHEEPNPTNLQEITENAVSEYREIITPKPSKHLQSDPPIIQDAWDRHSQSIILERLQKALREGVTLESTDQLVRPQEFRKVEILQPRYSGPGVKIEDTVAQTLEEETKKIQELEELTRILRRMALDVHFLQRHARAIDHRWRRKMRDLLKLYAANIHEQNALVGLSALRVYLDQHAEKDDRLEKSRLNRQQIDLLAPRPLQNRPQGPNL